MIAFPPNIERLVDSIYPLPRQQLAVAIGHASIVLYFFDIAWQIVALLLIWSSGAGERLRAVLNRRIRQPWFVAAAFVGIVVVALSVLTLPVTFYDGFTLQHLFGLSEESPGRWFRDWVVSVALGAIIAAVVGASFLRAIARWSSWPLIAALVAAPLLFFANAVYPVFITPLFNKFTPLPPSELTRSILAFAKQQGLNTAVVYEYNMSLQTRKADAYVAGLGQTERIAIGDTLLHTLKPDEVLYVVAHETGHYKLGHLWLGTFEAWAGTIALVLWIRFAGPWVLRRRQSSQQAELSDPAAVPVIGVLLLVFQLITAPAANALSRNIEHAADVFAAEHTRLGDAGVRAFARLASVDLSQLHPGPIEVWYFYTHPPTDERIMYAARMAALAAKLP